MGVTRGEGSSWMGMNWVKVWSSSVVIPFGWSRLVDRGIWIRLICCFSVKGSGQRGHRGSCTNFSLHPSRSSSCASRSVWTRSSMASSTTSVHSVNDSQEEGAAVFSSPPGGG